MIDPNLWNAAITALAFVAGFVLIVVLLMTWLLGVLVNFAEDTPRWLRIAGPLWSFLLTWGFITAAIAVVR